MSVVINDFLSRYKKEFDFYHNLAINIETKLKNELSRHGVRTIVSSRAKSISRLDVKLEDRNRTKKYKTVDNIYDDIVDLAGVRVALYFPGDMKVVEDIIKKTLKIHKIKRFPETDEKKKIGEYKKIFDGYSAVHFRVSINDDSRYGSNHCVEIQVASVLMHAWSEVEHDLIYKPLQGDLSQEELMILDEINGLVLSGNIALERLQKAGQDRINNSNSDELLNHYDLASFLLSRSSDINEDLLDFRMLFSILKCMGINKKKSVSGMLEYIHQEKKTSKRKINPSSIDSYMRYLIEHHHDKIESVFTSNNIKDPELFSVFKEMMWGVIEFRDSKNIAGLVLTKLAASDFELDVFGRDFFDDAYGEYFNFNGKNDNEVLSVINQIDDFRDKMSTGVATKEEIHDFINLCQSLSPTPTADSSLV